MFFSEESFSASVCSKFAKITLSYIHFLFSNVRAKSKTCLLIYLCQETIEWPTTEIKILRDINRHKNFTNYQYEGFICNLWMVIRVAFRTVFDIREFSFSFDWVYSYNIAIVSVDWLFEMVNDAFPLCGKNILIESINHSPNFWKHIICLKVDFICVWITLNFHIHLIFVSYKIRIFFLYIYHTIYNIIL